MRLFITFFLDDYFIEKLNIKLRGIFYCGFILKFNKFGSFILIMNLISLLKNDTDFRTQINSYTKENWNIQLELFPFIHLRIGTS